MNKHSFYLITFQAVRKGYTTTDTYMRDVEVDGSLNTRQSIKTFIHNLAELEGFIESSILILFLRELKE